MKAKAPNQVSTRKMEILNVITGSIQGRPSTVKESFDRIMHQKSMRLIKEERVRVANVIFDGGLTLGKIGLKEEAGIGDQMYSKVYVIDPELFEREQSHMPEWLQSATEDGADIDPIKEKDAIDLSTKYNSIEFSDA